jgi:hypothetical protein
MAKLIREIMVINEVRREEARIIASSMVAYFEHQIKHGKRVDLGFLKLVPKASKPTIINCNVGKKSVIHMGETTRWQTRIAKSWQKKNKPHWSRY